MELYLQWKELMKAGTEASRSAKLAQIDEKISEWVGGAASMLCRYDRNRYLLVLTQKNYQTLLDGKFSVLDSVRSIVTEDGVAATLSIGVGKDADKPMCVCAESSLVDKSAHFRPMLLSFLEKYAVGEMGLHAHLRVGRETTLPGSAAAALLNN